MIIRKFCVLKIKTAYIHRNDLEMSEELTSENEDRKSNDVLNLIYNLSFQLGHLRACWTIFFWCDGNNYLLVKNEWNKLINTSMALKGKTFVESVPRS